MTKVLFIVGSLREGSFNQQLAAQAEKVLEGKAEVSYLNWKDVPVFSQELETPVLPAVQAARDAVLAADAIWFFSPVYNANIPGSVKNLIDWLSRAIDLSDTTGASALHEKVTTVSIVSAAHQDLAADQYRALLPFVRTNFVDQVTTSAINPSAWADGTYVPSEEVLADLNKQADALLAAVK
ncbi:NAD(P)H-dependent oxidoreductase [Streptococcus minor]|uniref:NAD(P)H-dependent oxidoreductase n=1 Tax=Streptococcus minor TaxID=229549 RepID=A0A3P1VA76_9STRE|nr:NADPH-dependent FMN reductase [Streptococcus minor]MDO5079616.1 NADPH-dependent FMN reductase [Streptococcus minor]RRD30295.1 NAD(P)H-dependent oxidoreductase [Streptococcus minor]